MLRVVSLLGLLMMVGALVGLFVGGNLLSWEPTALVPQTIAVGLTVWARVTFGGRSFHASAEPTRGGLVKTGPYRYIRHPIYTSVCLFGWGSILAHWTLESSILGVLLLLGGLIRMLCEERLIGELYPEYAEYSKATKRMIPFVF